MSTIELTDFPITIRKHFLESTRLDSKRNTKDANASAMDEIAADSMKAGTSASAEEVLVTVKELEEVLCV